MFLAPSRSRWPHGTRGDSLRIWIVYTATTIGLCNTCCICASRPPRVDAWGFEVRSPVRSVLCFNFKFTAITQKH
eukprot:1140506-Prorocentrum_minimum.AAC.2